MRTLLFILAMGIAQIQAHAACTPASSGVGLCYPNFGDRGDVWAAAVRANFVILNSSVPIATSSPTYTNLITTGWLWVGSSVAANAGFYGNLTGNATTATTATNVASGGTIAAATAVLTGSLTASSATVTGAARINGKLGVSVAPESTYDLAVLSNLLITNPQMKIGDDGIISGGAANAISRIDHFTGKSLRFTESGWEVMRISASSVTIPINTFTVGGSTLSVKEGRVGVGGTPAYNLSVKAPTLNGNQSQGISIYNSGTGTGTGAMLGLGYGDAQASQARIAGLFDGVGPAMYFETAAAERMRITAGGNIGIGTTAPAYKLDIASGVINAAGTGAGFRVNGASGLSSLACAAGQTIGGATITGGIVTAGSCATPSGAGDVLLAATQTFTGENTFAGVASGVGLHSPGDFKWKMSISSSCGTGWLRADGSSISTTTYSALFAELGYSFGGSAANFALPDMNNGEFIRAVSTGTAGGNLTAGLGTKQLDAFQGHNHKLTGYGATGGNGIYRQGSGATAEIDAATTIVDGGYGTPRISTETRPRNYALIPCVYSGVK